VKPETLKSILSLARNADNCTSAVGSGSSGPADGDKSGVTSHGRDTGSDDVSRDVTGERSSSESDESESQRDALRSESESFDPSQDKQMRLATEGQLARRCIRVRPQRVSCLGFLAESKVK